MPACTSSCGKFIFYFFNECANIQERGMICDAISSSRKRVKLTNPIRLSLKGEHPLGKPQRGSTDEAAPAYTHINQRKDGMKD